MRFGYKVVKRTYSSRKEVAVIFVLSSRLKVLCLHIITLSFIVSSGTIVNAEEPGSEIPKIVLTGLEVYKSEGPEAAIVAWIKGGPSEGDKTALSQANLFRQVESFYGKYIGYELIHIETLTSSSKLLYLQMNFEKGPVFCSFLCYLKGSSWILSGKFSFNTDPELVLPSSLLAK